MQDRSPDRANGFSMVRITMMVLAVFVVVFIVVALGVIAWTTVMP